MKKILFFLASILVCMGGVMATNAQATVYDISNDFSVSLGNPNGVWTYGYATTLTTVTLYDQPSAGGGIEAWRSSVVQNAAAPADWNNSTNSAVGSLSAHTAAFHPGPEGQFSVYRFTSPVAATFNLSAIFAAIDYGGTDVHILLNGVDIYSHEIDPSNTPESFNTVLALLAGDHVDFAVGWGTDLNFGNDSTSINASLSTSATPLPAALPLFAIGLGALGLLGWRRKRKALAA